MSSSAFVYGAMSFTDKVMIIFLFQFLNFNNQYILVYLINHSWHKANASPLPHTPTYQNKEY